MRIRARSGLAEGLLVLLALGTLGLLPGCPFFTRRDVEDAAVHDPQHLPRPVLHGVLAQGHLSVSRDGTVVAWADPDTGLSFAYLTNGLDAHPIRQAKRGVALSSIAADCAR